MLQARRRLFYIYQKRNFCQLPSKLVMHTFKNRSLIRTSGNDVSVFLQGLITNDIKHLDGGPGSMFTMFLNTQGRVLFDAIIYRYNEGNTYFIECDTQALEPLQKHLKIYRLRRKVDIVSINDEYNVSVLFNPNVIDLASLKSLPKGTDGVIVPCEKLKVSAPDPITSTKIFDSFSIYKDPRLAFLGSRVISKNNYDQKQLNSALNTEVSDCDEQTYRRFRFMLGVGEGVSDLPPGECFPLESNCDYLHGVSFHKGCYIGQELTARTHHTGVVRKRLMPMLFNKKPTRLPTDNKIVDKAVNLGKLRGIEDNVGLGLLRIAKVLELKEFDVGSGVASAYRPSWWPVEAPKERISVQKL